jgi:hypothetical protein
MALRFAGNSGSFAEIANGYNRLSGLNASISAWMKISNYNFGFVIATKDLSLGGVFVEVNNSAGGIFPGINTNYSLLSNAAFAIDTWFNVLFVPGNASGEMTQVQIYVNGVLTRTGPNIAAWTTSANKSLWLARWDTASFWGAVTLADIRTWNRRLTSAEACDVYQGKSVSSGLTSWWKLDETSGSTFADSVGSLPGAITGTPDWVSESPSYGASGSSRPSSPFLSQVIG